MNKLIMSPVVWNFFCKDVLKILLIIGLAFGTREHRRVASMLPSLGESQGYRLGLGVSNNIRFVEQLSTWTLVGSWQDTPKSAISSISLYLVNDPLVHSLARYNISLNHVIMPLHREGRASTDTYRHIPPVSLL